MKRKLTLAVLSVVSAGALASCSSEPPPRHVHHSHSRTYYRSSNSYNKPAGVSGGTSTYSNSPEGFSAVTPPASYSY